MSTYSIRCRHDACRHRRVSRTHPDDYKVVPKCPVCGNRKGWRIEQRAYNKRNLCHCSGPDMAEGRHFPHRTTHPLCDQHPHGFYNQARAQGVAHDDIPEEYRPMDTLLTAITEVHQEVETARANWPGFNSAHEGFAVLLEEVDELKAHVWTNQKRRDLGAMRKEAMQVAAMALRFMTEVCDEERGRK